MDADSSPEVTRSITPGRICVTTRTLNVQELYEAVRVDRVEAGVRLWVGTDLSGRSMILAPEEGEALAYQLLALARTPWTAPPEAEPEPPTAMQQIAAERARIYGGEASLD